MKLTAEQVREVIEKNVKFYEGGDYDEKVIADELNAELESGTCKYDETEIIPVIRIFAKDTFANDPLGERIHVLECTVCGGTYEHVNGDYEYCPRCGRRCEGEQTWSV